MIIQRILADGETAYRIVAYDRNDATYADYCDLGSLIAAIRSAAVPIEEVALRTSDSTADSGSIIFSADLHLDESQCRALDLSQR